MPVFLERFLLGVCAAAFFAVVFTNVMSFDTTQRVTAAIALFFGAYFFAHTVFLHNEASKKTAKEPATQPQENGSAPDLRGQIEQAMFGQSGARLEDAGITMIVSIRNAGTPSIVERWDLIVDVPKAGRFSTTMPYFEGELALPSATHPDKTVVYNADDLLYKKTITPIPTGSMIRGILVFIVKGVDRDVVYQKGTKIELSFSDVTGKRYTVSQEVRTGPNDILGVFPGMKTEVRQEAKSTSEAVKSNLELTGAIERIGVGILGGQPNDAGIFIIARVKNAGAPTIVDGWSLEVIPPNNKPLSANLKYINPNEPITLNLGGDKPWLLSPDDALYNKTADNPLPSGGQITGVLIFALEKTKREDIYRLGTVLNLSFSDVKGNKYTASYTITEKPDNRPTYYPGMKPPPTP